VSQAFCAPHTYRHGGSADDLRAEVQQLKDGEAAAAVSVTAAVLRYTVCMLLKQPGHHLLYLE
jgi:hypothetical protein